MSISGVDGKETSHVSTLAHKPNRDSGESSAIGKTSAGFRERDFQSFTPFPDGRTVVYHFILADVA